MADSTPGTPRLCLEDRLKMLMPPAIYFAHKSGKEISNAEPELAILDRLVDPARGALDIGANRGIYAYALSRRAAWVKAFEPLPQMAEFARWMLRGRAELHEMALGSHNGEVEITLPYDPIKKRFHPLLATTTGAHEGASVKLHVPQRTLDSFNLTGVGFLKVDVEGAEENVLKGGQKTIAANRPVLLVEAFTKWVADSEAAIARIETNYGYNAFILTDGDLKPARAVLEQWPSPRWTRNVVFRPREQVA